MYAGLKVGAIVWPSALCTERSPKPAGLLKVIGGRWIVTAAV